MCACVCVAACVLVHVRAASCDHFLINFSVSLYSVAPPVEMLYPCKQFADIVIYLKPCFDRRMWQVFFLYSKAVENMSLYITKTQ